MSDRFNHNSKPMNARTMEYDRQTQLLKNMESVHLRKKAAFEELFRYTYSNVKPQNNRSDSENP